MEKRGLTSLMPGIVLATSGIGNVCFGFDIFPICTEPGEPEGSLLSPKVSGDTVVWWDFRNLTADIYGYNLLTKTEFAVATDEISSDDYPKIDGNVVVWHKVNEQGASDVFGYNLNTQAQFAISTGAENELLPDVGGNYAVWQDYRNGNSDIYGAEIIPEPMTLSLLSLGGLTIFRRRRNKQR